MSRTFLVDDARVRRLSATRQGRVSLGGFAYQAGYAVARLASLHARRPLPDLPGVPVRLRYDWAEDLDEMEADGRAVFTQCKRIADIGQPASLAGILTGLAPKWLWAPAERRAELRFRLVCPDPRFLARGPVALAADGRRDQVLAAAEAVLAKPPAASSDRALWQADAEAAGLRPLLEALWDQTEVLYLPAEPLTDDVTGPLLPAERAALDLLMRCRHLEPSRQGQALAALRSLLDSNIVEHDALRGLPPRVLDGDDVRYALFDVQTPPNEEKPPFQVVTRVFLEQEAARRRRPYMARPPQWADVVHGQSAETRFLEREPTERLLAQVRELLENAADDEVLPALFVLGAPGAGKSTLVRRVAAQAVQEGLAVVAAPKLNLERIDDADVSTLLRALARLEEGTLPVLLVLDDPLFAESGWDHLLRRLAPRSRRTAVLAASPDYLFHEHHHRLGKQVDVRTFALPRPRRPEREALALLHGRDPALFEEREDDFLVLAMEASAGASFESLVERLWTTLNQGRPIDPRTRPDELSWLVRAYLVVCYWHRFGMTCPEVVLGAILDHAHRDPLAPSCRYELQRLVSEQGWEVFTVTEPARHLAFLGARIGASHPRIAAEAWRLRPVQPFDVGEWVAEASLAAQPAGVDLGILACRVGEPGLRDRLVALWNRAAQDGMIETRNLCLLHAALSLHGAAAAARRLEAGLAVCARRLDGQSWLAVLALLHYGKGGGLPPGLDLPSVIEVADLHLAPGRATMLLSLLEGSPEALGAVLDRIAATAEDAGTGHLLARLVAARPGDREVCARAFSWLRSYEGASGTAELLVQLVEAAPADPDLLREALSWLPSHAGHPNVRRLLVPLVDANPTHPELRRWALRWIGENEGWLKAQRVLARLVERSGGDEEVLRLGEEHVRRHGSPRVLKALLAASGASPRAVGLALDWLGQPQKRSWTRDVMAALGKALAADPPAAVRSISGCVEEDRKKLLLEALARALQEDPARTTSLLEALSPLASRDLSLLLLHLLRTRSEPVETFLAAWLADARSQEDRDSLLRSIRSKPPLRERLLARGDLAPEVRGQLLDASPCAEAGGATT